MRFSRDARGQALQLVLIYMGHHRRPGDLPQTIARIAQATRLSEARVERAVIEARRAGFIAPHEVVGLRPTERVLH